MCGSILTTVWIKKYHSTDWALPGVRRKKISGRKKK